MTADGDAVAAPQRRHRVRIQDAGTPDAAQLLAKERAARTEAEAARDLLARLHRVSAALAGATTEQEVADVILGAGMLALGAVRGMVAVRSADGTLLDAVAWHGYPKDIRDRWPNIAVDADLPLSEAVRTGESIVLPSPEVWRARYPLLENEQSDHRSVAVIPLPSGSGGSILGAMAFSFEQERGFPADELMFMRVLGQQCGQAMERARLFESERRARAEAEENQERLGFLVDAGLALSSSLGYEATLSQVADLAVPRIADWCSVMLVERDGSLRSVAVAHADPAMEPVIAELAERFPARPDAPHGAHAVARAGRSKLFPEITDDLLVEIAQDDEHLRLLRSLGFVSALLVPLMVHGRVLGVLTLIQGSSGRRFDQDDVPFVEHLARRSAQAVENARLFQERTHIARTLQASLLPPHLPDIAGVDLGVAYEAAGESYDVGGDFFDAFETQRGEWTLLVGDVCGKGPDAAATTALARHTLRAAAMRTRDPRRMLRILNEAMLRAETAFCTVGCVRLRRAGGELTATIVCGGHPLPLLAHADGSASFVGRTGMLIGSFPQPTLPPYRLHLLPGDALVLYTDGVVEASGPAGPFGDERLRALVARRASSDAATMAAAIRDEVMSFQEGEPRDDIAVLVAKVLPAP